MAKSTVSTSICFKLLDQTIKAKIYGEEFTASSINLLPEENTVECYGRIFENSEIMKTFGDGTVKDKKWCKERVSFWSEQFNSGNPFGPLLYKSLDENDFLGISGLSKSEEKGAAELFYLVDSDKQGKGFGKKFAKSLVSTEKDEPSYVKTLIENGYTTINDHKFTDIIATARTDNQASMKILESLGMKSYKIEEKHKALRHYYKKSVESL